MRGVCVVLLALMLTGGAARAQEDVPLFVPTSAWLVGPATLKVAAAERVPCLMVNQYDNGFNLRISGGDRQILAMAVDLRQAAFTTGGAYKAQVTIPGTFSEVLTGTAYGPTTLIINTQDYAGLYEALEGASRLRMDLEGSNSMEFALLGIRDGLARMEQCFSGDGGVKQAEIPATVPGMKQTLYNKSAPPPAQEKAPEPVEEAAPALVRDALPGQEEAAAVPVEEKAAEEPQESGGLSIASLLKAASNNIKGMNVKKPGEEEEKAAAKKKEDAAPRDIMVQSPAAQAPGAPVERRWRAMKGSNLREVLDVWAQNENAELVWTAGQDFDVRGSISVQGTFETAVSSVLEQYGNDHLRPVGRVYFEPGTYKKVLLIEVVR